MSIGSNAKNKIKLFFTPEELAEYFSISKATVYRLANKRQLPFHKINGVLRFNREDVEKYLEETRIEPIRLNLWE